MKLADYHHKDNVLMRDVYCATLMELAEKDDSIVVLDADLMKSMGMVPFFEKYKNRAFDCGVQEANMIGVAAGMSATGKIPFVHTFGPFASRRCYDQAFLSVGYAKLNVRIVGSDPGITAAYNGGTHMPFEDMALMRSIPDAIVIEPVDNVMLKSVLKQVKDIYGLIYIRLLRKNPFQIYNEGTEFEIGKGITLKEGKDITLITSGYLCAETLKAAEALEKEGVSARVVNIFTWKPIDEALITQCARETGAIVTVENHSVINGLGSAVADVITKHHPVVMGRIGSQDRFGQVGSVDYLLKEYQMTADDIVKKAHTVLSKKLGGSKS